MTSPEDKHYQAIKAELAEAANIHPLGGGPVDEIIALSESGQHVAAEAVKITAAKELVDTLEEWRRQAEAANQAPNPDNI